MADFTPKAKPEDIPFEFQTQFGDAAELDRIAQMMMAQRAAIQRNMGLQMVPGGPGVQIAVRASPMQGLADMFAAYQGGQASREAQRMRSKIGTDMAAAEGADKKAVLGQLMGNLEPIGPPDPTTGEMGLQGNMGNPAKAAQLALASRFENVRKLGEQLRQQASSNFSSLASRATPESIAIAQAQGGNPQALTAEPKETFGNLEPMPGWKGRPGEIAPMGQFSSKDKRFRVADTGSNVSVSVSNRPPEATYEGEMQTGMAKEDVQLFRDARAQEQNLAALQRVKGILAEGKVTAGPEFTAVAETTVRNLFNEYGLPLDRALDQRNAKLTAEGASFLAAKILAGGRAITDQDIQRIAKTFPNIGAGIPYGALPGFISQLESIGASQIQTWNNRYKSIPEETRKRLPATLGLREVGIPGARPAGGYTDPEKEKRYQEWKASQGVK